MSKTVVRILGLLLALSPLWPPGPAAAQNFNPPPGFPANIRPDLYPKWVDGKGTIRSWPPNNGCANAETTTFLPAGTEIDRFGSDFGTFLSPRGVRFAARAVPYVCGAMPYSVFRVAKPLAVRTCTAAPWFTQPGGAIQFDTQVPVNALVAAGELEVVQRDPGGTAQPGPQCGK